MVKSITKTLLCNLSCAIQKARNLLPKSERLRRIIRRGAPSVRLGICLVSVIVILANISAILILFTFENQAAGFISGGDPKHFREELRIDLLDDYKGVFGIAHNSGNRISSTVEALAYDVDVIEIDVVMVDGKLHAAHWSPFRFIGNRFFRGPTLEDVWGAAAQANVIELDLKTGSTELVDRLLLFLNDRRMANTEVVVVSDKPEILTLLHEKEPRLIRMLSVSNSDKLSILLGDETSLNIIDGISVKHSLLTMDSVLSLKKSGLIVFAFTVNDAQRMNQLVEYGVDGITTDNLAIMQFLGTQQRDETTLRDRIHR